MAKACRMCNNIYEFTLFSYPFLSFGCSLVLQCRLGAKQNFINFFMLPIKKFHSFKKGIPKGPKHSFIVLSQVSCGAYSVLVEYTHLVVS